MISVIVPTLNEEIYLGKLLDSITAQDFSEDIEIIVADTNSKDRTREVAESYRTRFASVRIVEGGLPAKARNNGGRVASGDILVFLDADMRLPDPLFLKKNLEYFRAKNLVIASTLFTPASDKLIDHVLTTASNLAIRALKRIHPLGSMCVIATRDVFLKSGGYPEDRVMAEDHDFVARCIRFGKFDLLPVKSEFSVRRFEKEGRLSIAWKYVLTTLHIMFIGPVTKPLFKYEFGDFKKEK